MNKMQTLVIYDVSSDRLRERLANRLFDYGLQRVQLSAFSGELNPHDRHAMLKELANFVGSERDRIYVAPSASAACACGERLRNSLTNQRASQRSRWSEQKPRSRFSSK